MKKIAYIVLTALSIIGFQSCEDTYLPPPLEYVTFGNTSYSAGVDVGGSTTVDIPVYTGSIVSSDKSFNVIVDGSGAAAGSYSVPSSVTIPSGSNEGTLVVSLSDVDLGIGVNRLTISFESGIEGLTIGDDVNVQYTQNCTEVTATLDLSFDRWGSEVYWEIQDALGGVVASTAGYPDTGSGTSTTDSVTITLCSGRDYTFYVEDGYGDGWGAGSSYVLTINGVVKVSGDGSGLDPTGVSTPFDTY